MGDDGSRDEVDDGSALAMAGGRGSWCTGPAYVRLARSHRFHEQILYARQQLTL